MEKGLKSLVKALFQEKKLEKYPLSTASLEKVA
jgi:hypothetical protein